MEKWFYFNKLSSKYDMTGKTLMFYTNHKKDLHNNCNNNIITANLFYVIVNNII